MQPLILLHGAIGAKDQLMPLANVLKNDFEVHLINFSGHGGNPFPQNPFSIELFASDVIEYMVLQKIEQASIFGYSMGGYAGMFLAKYYPQKIKKLITLATKFNWDEHIAAKEIKMLDADTIQQKIPAFATQLAERHAPQDWRQLLDNTKQLLLNLGKKNALQLEDYKTINVSSLLLLGDRDKMVALEETVAVYKQLPSASLSVLPNTPHPIEQVDPHVLGFLIKLFLLP